MRKICLTLPTNRACAETISAVLEEAAYAAEHFDVEVHLLILDSSDEPALTEHAKVAHESPTVPNVIVHHLGEAEQREFLQRVIHHAGVAKPELVLELMLPSDLSYGACTNRAFLIGAALGCESIHRRDSDILYQVVNDAPVFPIHHELMSIGKRASDAVDGVDETTLDPNHAHKPVTMVGSSFVGEMSVDIGEMYRLDRDAYYDVVSLWAPGHWSDERKRELVDESFRGAGSEAFTHDHSTLTIVDPMRVDMSNIAFHQVQEWVPLPPATDTIGSDYFLIHLVHDAALPGVLHNRHLVNFYTPERRTGPGFIAYQMRFVKFFLSMLYFNFVYDRMAEAGESLLDDRDQVRIPAITEFVRESTLLDRAENIQRLDTIDRSYRKLGGKYAEFADIVASRRERLLDEAQQDNNDFALLIEAWAPMIHASRTTQLQRQPG
ncbi:DUF6271 family protein [Actinacidiphila soli]|jgi:hypothetical protein|uniref:DUF6271 family protein n=1 Tax=Actinacidiphila soli TaxID=2487275 RepID=UPI000FC9F91F|nr:DUF6271 family protein [Actinacidiphila soli]